MAKIENSRLTQKRIQNALLELLLEYKIEDITVKQISERSYTSRVNFYNYFVDKYDVLVSLENEFLVTFKAILTENSGYLVDYRNLSDNELHEKLYENALKNMQHFKAHQLLIKTAQHDNASSTFMSRLYEMYQKHFQNALPNMLYADKSKFEIDNAVTFITKGVASILDNWIADDFQKSPESIAKIMIDLILTSLRFINNS